MLDAIRPTIVQEVRLWSVLGVARRLRARIEVRRNRASGPTLRRVQWFRVAVKTRRPMHHQQRSSEHWKNLSYALLRCPQLKLSTPLFLPGLVEIGNQHHLVSQTVLAMPFEVAVHLEGTAAAGFVQAAVDELWICKQVVDTCQHRQPVNEPTRVDGVEVELCRASEIRAINRTQRSLMSPGHPPPVGGVEFLRNEVK